MIANRQSLGRPEPSREPRRLVVLGATGSIGRSTADVLDSLPGQFRVEAIVGGRDAEALAAMALRLGARCAVLADPAGYKALKAALSGHDIELAAGPEAVEAAALRPSDLVIAAITGTAGVAPTHAALCHGRNVALANKESLVCAGGPVMRDAARAGARILPLDSEHNAIFQALQPLASALRESGPAIERMTLTASGGPFRTWPAERMAAATCAEALAHPKWSMGHKVTINSATLMNKGLELIEAHHLFGVPPNRLDVLVHPQSIIHGLVAFADGAVVAGLAHPDMKVPIAYCLGFPERLPTKARRLDLAEVATLTFEAPDLHRFPALGLAIEALRAGGGLPTILNAANEVAVAAFLARKIGFGQIAGLVEATCNACLADGSAREPCSVAEALVIDHIARERAGRLLA